MDRLPRPFVALGLGLLLAAAGCRATRPEVPPARPFSKDGQQRQAISFSSDGHPPGAVASNSLMTQNLGGSDLAAGIASGGSKPNAAAFGAPPGAYGAPGTSGLSQTQSQSQPGLSDPSMTRASTAPSPMPPPGMLPPGLPPLDPPAASPQPQAAPNSNLSTMPEPREVPNQVIQPPIDKPGAMGTPEQMPSPF